MGLRTLAAEFLPAALQGLQRPSLVSPTEVVPPPEALSYAALADKLGYLGKADLRLVREAYRFADEAHLGQFRASGQPYITHPIAVAGLCADWRLDVQAIMAALLHDAMEDCGIKKPELIERFGAPTADLVDGLTKLDKLRFSTREEGQAESFRKMLLAMARDVRVILIKLADRLHNMRTMEAMAPAKRGRIARETLDIYAPIAHRLGLNQTYRELQELSFQHLHPWRHAALAKAVARARGHRRDIVERIQKEVERAFAAQKIKLAISGREKTVYSVYRKMREKRDGFADVSDIFGFRAVVPQLSDCYLALGVLHGLYKPVPGRFKDYIAIPKANGYQSLHTTVVSPLGTAIEFQIRTEAMHAVAERGIAAHWMYKQAGKGAAEAASAAQQLGALWLQSLLDIQDETRDAAEFLEHVKVDLTPDAVYVFTPRSKILALPRGATPIDFAYAIHSDVGDRLVAAKVNGEPVALRTELKSGDVVEAITSPGARPHPGWLNMVRTGRARSKIRHHLKTMESEEAQALGAKMLAQALRAEGLRMPGADAEDADTVALWQQAARWAGLRTRHDLLVEIGMGRKLATIVAKRMAQAMGERGIRPDPLLLTLGRYGEADDAAAAPGVVFVDGSEGGSVQLASCCRPIPGDAVIGHLGRGEGLAVHAADCPVGRRLFERDRERLMRVEWAEDIARSFPTLIEALVTNGKGALAQVAAAVAAAEADILHLDMGQEPAADAAELKLLVSVRDRQHLADVLRTLRRVPSVQKVARAPDAGSAGGARRRRCCRRRRRGRRGRRRRRRGGVTHLEHLEALHARRRGHADLVAHPRLQQRARHRRDPAHLTLQRVDFVDALDRDRALAAGGVGVGDGGAEEHLVAAVVQRRVGDLGDVQPLRQEADAAVDLAQPLLAVEVVAVLAAVAVARRPRHRLHDLRPLDVQQRHQLRAQPRVARRRHVVARAGGQRRQAGGLVERVGIVAFGAGFGFLREGLAHRGRDRSGAPRGEAPAGVVAFGALARMPHRARSPGAPCGEKTR
jgi:GTP pyrophosphokinase/guanosine-3',5'-bis(diphosphate) 3'-pyrophosphohydrolase